jgi:hypothetical protein
MLWRLYEAIRRDVAEPAHLDELRWHGVGMNAGQFQKFVSTDDLFRAMYSTHRLNQLIDPVDLGVDGFGLATETTLATMGIFNPSGPTVGSIEIAVNYRIGAALLLERSRHPHYPTTQVHAVLDRDGFNNIDRLLEGLVGRLEWSTFDWWDIRTATDRDAAAMRRGLQRFAVAHPDNDYERLALELLETLHDPWARVDHGFETSLVAPVETDPIGLWIEAICHPENVDNHCAFVRSAWEGASAWLAAVRRGDDEAAAEARRAADRVRWNVWARKGPTVEPA